MAAANETHDRVPALDGVRACSILLVVSAHSLPLGPKAWEMNLAIAHVGMSLFFCLSGYLIVSLLQKNSNVGLFIAKRFARIVPSVFVYLIILMVFFNLPWTSLFYNMMFVSNYFHSGLQGGPVGHLWSLSVEMQFYVAIALAVWAFGVRGLWLVPPAAAAITLLRMEAGVVANIMTHLRADEIMAGGCLALLTGPLARRPLLMARLRRSAPALLAVATALLVASGHEAAGFLVYFRPYFAATVVGLAVVVGWPPLTHALCAPAMRYIARISYALYIYHMLMIWGFMNEGSTFERYALKRPVSFLMMWAAAHASTVLLEEPVNRFVRRRLAGWRSSTPIAA